MTLLKDASNRKTHCDNARAVTEINKMLVHRICTLANTLTSYIEENKQGKAP